MDLMDIRIDELENFLDRAKFSFKKNEDGTREYTQYQYCDDTVLTGKYLDGKRHGLWETYSDEYKEIIGR